MAAVAPEMPSLTGMSIGSSGDADLSTLIDYSTSDQGIRKEVRFRAAFISWDWLGSDEISTYCSFRSLLLFWRPIRSLLSNRQRLSAAQRVEMGQRIVRTFSEKYLDRNHGKFLAVDLEARVPIAVADSMRELYAMLRLARPKTDYYIERIGYPSIGDII
jgi:hypothetical protein